MTTSSQQLQRRRVWDLAVRVFHWSLVIFFTTAYLSAEEEDWLHANAGYVILGLVLFRIVWGFIGSKHARFSDFIYRPAEIMAYARGLFRGRPKHYRGHNPLGGLMVLALLGTLLLTTVSGLKVYGLEGHGPLAQTQSGWLIANAYASSPYQQGGHHHGDEEGEELWEDIHEFFANLMLVLIALHIGGALVSSALHRENLVKAMITGYKSSSQPEQGEQS